MKHFLATLFNTFYVHKHTLFKLSAPFVADNGLKTSKIDAFSPLYKVESVLYGIQGAIWVSVKQGMEYEFEKVI